MTFHPLLKDRHVIPRWRSLRTTVSSGELAMPRKATEAIARNPSEELVRRLEAFRLRPDKFTATEVIETAIVEGLPEEAVRPERDRGGIHSSVARWRSATRSYPHDPLAWVELALGYVTLGKNESALRAIA